MKKIGFIGAGNMGRSLIGGLLADEYDPKKIFVANPSTEKLDRLHSTFGVYVTTDNIEVARQVDVLVLAVKPQVVKNVIKELAPILLEHRPLIVSIAAGVRTNNVEGWLAEDDFPIVRAMPNTPALLRCGASAMFANAHVTETQRELAESILRAVGVVVWVNDEQQLDVITALSGSGPAYFFLLIESLVDAAKQLGLSDEVASLLTRQTALGAARMALESSQSAEELRENVTSPGGTTERAMQTLSEGKFRELMYNAVDNAAKRADELANQLN